jgi:hypothetical protein
MWIGCRRVVGVYHVDLSLSKASTTTNIEQPLQPIGALLSIMAFFLITPSTTWYEVKQLPLLMGVTSTHTEVPSDFTTGPPLYGWTTPLSVYV